MRITISKIGSLTINEKHQSLSVQSQMTDIQKREVLAAPICNLYLDNRGIRCTVSSLNENKKGTTFLLHLNRSNKLTAILERFVHQKLECVLTIAEEVDKILFDEAQRLLEDVAKSTGRNIEEILKELTAYKEGVEPKEDLRFISNRQLPVLIAKLRKYGAGEVHD